MNFFSKKNPVSRNWVGSHTEALDRLNLCWNSAISFLAPNSEQPHTWSLTVDSSRTGDSPGHCTNHVCRAGFLNHNLWRLHLSAVCDTWIKNQKTRSLILSKSLLLNFLFFFLWEIMNCGSAHFHEKRFLLPPQRNPTLRHTQLLHWPASGPNGAKLTVETINQRWRPFLWRLLVRVSTATRCKLNSWPPPKDCSMLPDRIIASSTAPFR